jgi:hypothetical protein
MIDERDWQMIPATVRLNCYGTSSVHLWELVLQLAIHHMNSSNWRGDEVVHALLQFHFFWIVSLEFFNFRNPSCQLRGSSAFRVADKTDRHNKQLLNQILNQVNTREFHFFSQFLSVPAAIDFLFYFKQHSSSKFTQ